MKKILLISLLILAALFTIPESFSGQQVVFSEPRWYKGNTHTHTLKSDGDTTPDDVVKWYREHGYNFIVITDHDSITEVSGLNSLHGKEGSFIVIRGEEVTDRFDKRPYHVNGLGLQSVVKPQNGQSVVENLQRNVDAVRAANGIPQINHPNFGWAITAKDLKRLENVKLFEIYSGHPLINYLGGGGAPGTEEIWDAVLSSGKLLYGVASDDSHHFKRIGDRTAATPGHGWVMVRAKELSPNAILAAMERGDFYASTGVELAEYTADEKEIAITIKEERESKYRVLFIGNGGRILKETNTSPAVYRFRGDEVYVRAKVIESNGKIAWTQPVFHRKGQAERE